MTEDTEEFVRAGLRYYADATATVKRFRDVAQKELAAGLGEYTREPGRMGTPTCAPYPDKAADDWIAVNQKLQVQGEPQERLLHIGLWWNSVLLGTPISSPVVLFATFWTGPVWLSRDLDVQGLTLPYAGKLWNGRTYVYRALPDPATVSIAPDVKALLGALQAAVHRSAPVIVPA